MENTTVIVSRYGTIKPPGSSLPALTVVAKVDPAMPEVVEEVGDLACHSNLPFDNALTTCRNRRSWTKGFWKL